MAGRARAGFAGARASACALVFACMSAAVHAGPPFQTDDPEPVERGHVEINLIGQSTRDTAGTGGSVVAEVNVGCAAETQCHVALPRAFDRPTGGPAQAGLGDAELGIKYRFLDRPDDGWSAAVYPTLLLPTGDAHRGLGNGRAQLLLPAWVQKTVGDWSMDAGVAWLVDRAPGARDSWYQGVLLQRAFGDRFTLGAELFHRSSTTPGDPDVTGIDLGAILRVAPHQNVLFSAGRGLVHPEADRASLFLAYQLEM
jgi:hypothetical protein